jgi:hypothetical protein
MPFYPPPCPLLKIGQGQRRLKHLRERFLLTAANKITGGQVGQSADGAYKLFEQSNGSSPLPSTIAERVQGWKKDDSFLHSGKCDSNVSQLYLFNAVRS